MKQTTRISSLVFKLVVLIFSVFLSFQAIAENLSKVATNKVCMINNQVFAKDQIPTQVDGKTYYGCCAMCAGKLAGDPSTRQALDPVSNKTVDKATAVIGADKEGNVYYFENEKNLNSFVAN